MVAELEVATDRTEPVFGKVWQTEAVNTQQAQYASSCWATVMLRVGFMLWLKQPVTRQCQHALVASSLTLLLLLHLPLVRCACEEVCAQDSGRQ